MADPASSNVSPLITWLVEADVIVQSLALVLASVILALLLFRLPELVKSLPAVADAIARVRGKGETDRERELARQVVELQARVSTLEATIRNVMQHYEEWDAITSDLLPSDDACMVPGCGMAAAVGNLRRLRQTREALPPIAAG